MTSSPRTALSEAAADGAESEWEPLPAVELGSRITSLQWGEEDVRVLTHSLRYKVASRVAVLRSLDDPQLRDSPNVGAVASSRCGDRNIVIALS